ncbi:hypothetical protein [Parasporobacterium paucivorans]|nr:hypothetical protein [Parasporobacterium paucivorans]
MKVSKTDYMEEIKQAYRDYKETEFGGWPFVSLELYHDANQV